ncbi:TonB-dependent receptor [Alkalilimnicola ehrlichii MLHE-1]|uniref:TonB-dependent receptor n=1 Tax=Alkalilimnicola ehrlichii (strain ATCC BAA-1101 / DSM 17681 / MLHE-1) TaxID=187272 RepID=Q0A4T2_ALKEH|nr:TonB-dependent receptor [Alkalilimnicola ehrlichii]ABI58155.1 TonB-dependent receptor [Alkalilimnicola ehrlichii MLHE-1]
MSRYAPLVATAASLFVVATLVPAIAQADSAEARPLSPIVVTPARTAQTVNESLSSVTVIDREEIDRQQPKQFTDLLAGRAGVTVSSNGPFGKASSVRLRGADSGHTVLLIDGVRMGSATLGGASWQVLPLSEIERVEVVRGPRSAIYGADAIGGVVQIFTREGREGPPRVNAFAGAGSFGTHEYGAGVAGGTADTRYRLSGSHFHTDGIDVQDGVGDDDDDGYRNSSLSGKVSHRLSNGWELFANGLRSEGRSEFDRRDFFGNDESAHHDFVHQATRIGARGDVTDRWHTELSIAHARDEQDTYYEGELDARHDTKRDQAHWLNDFVLTRTITWTAGLDWQEERVSGTTDYDETSRYNQAAYQVLAGRFGRHNVSGSLRYDDNQAYGSHTTGQLAWGYEIDDRLQGRLSYGTAFNAPTLNDLYWPGSGNPDLQPEESATAEAGLRYAGGAFYWDAALFRTEVDDLIEWAPVNGQWMPDNVDEARITGLELEGGYHQGPWRLRASGTFLDTEDKGTGRELRRRPNHTVRLDVDRELGAWAFGATALARGRSFNDKANDDRLAGHGLLHLRASYAIDPHWTVRAKLDNALDKDYATARDGSNEVDYNQPDRAVFVSIHYAQ